MRSNSIKRFGRRSVPVAMLVLAATAVVTGLAFGRVVAAHDPAEHVREVLQQSATAFAQGDKATINKVWANDESHTVFEQGHANYGWTDYRDHHLMPEMKEMKNTKYTLSDIKVKVAGTTAWATFKYAISADVDGHHVDGGGARHSRVGQ